MVKHLLNKKREKGLLVWELVFPVLIVFYIRFLTRNSCDSSECDAKEQMNAKIRLGIANPIIMSMVVPSIFSIGQRYILQSMVYDKNNKMRETLRLMSLSQFSYAISYFIMQAIVALFTAVVLTIGLQGNKNIFSHDDGYDHLRLGAGVFLFALASIPYVMCLSTFFNDPRLAAQMGGLFLLLP